MIINTLKAWKNDKDMLLQVIHEVIVLKLAKKYYEFV